MLKLYFYDIGLVCSLLGIESAEDLAFHYLRGGLFEAYVVFEIIKKRYNKGRLPNCYFWRDKTGNEVDCIIEQGQKLHGIEIKANKTITQSYFIGYKLLEQHSQRCCRYIICCVCG